MNSGILSLFKKTFREDFPFDTGEFKYKKITLPYQQVLDTYKIRARNSNLTGAYYGDLISRIEKFEELEISIHSFVMKEEGILLFTNKNDDQIIGYAAGRNTKWRGNFPK